jgi:phosphoglycerate dehydrogenase-like enzyme
VNPNTHSRQEDGCTTMTGEFRIGLSPDFQKLQIAQTMHPVLQQKFGHLPCVSYDFWYQAGDVVTPDEVKDYDAVILLASRFGPESLKGAERLAIIARWGVGYDNVHVPACTEADVLLAITTDAVRRPMGESIMAFLLALSRKLVPKEKLARTGRWDLRGQVLGTGLKGRAFGTVGMGNIGTEMFRLLRPFEPGRMLAHDPYATNDQAAQMGVELVDLPTLFRESDYVIINCPLNDETRGMIGADLLSLMKPTAYLVNTARGGIIQEGELITILREGKIAGAAIDVFEQEPTPPDNPLLQLDNVVVTPHSLAWGEDVFRANSVDASDNVLTVLRGEVPRYTVNREVVERPGFQAKLRSLGKRWSTLAH